MKRWEAIRLSLLQDMRGGAFCPGDKLPADSELAARFGVNRHTVRQAIRTLETEGTVRVQHGVGTFVADDFISHELTRDPRLTDSPAFRSRLIKREILSISVTAASEEIAEPLAIRPLDLVTRVVTLSVVDGKPLSISVASYPLERVSGLAEAFEGLNSPTAALRKCGIDAYQRSWTRIGARRADREESEQLQISVGSPVLTDTNLDTSDGMAIKFASNVIRSDRFEFMIRDVPQR
ncbi:phosphonate metabolism transcriptional regulator PhnF [Sphingomonas sp. 3P27F8]|uniref:phosphonate metabolism transcriptional regulator PhnF n=1 Tax=Sphingomonas sp. 3P27F8 TaxID=2502213 RepID=UPI00148583F0|nr:phosphonate metabolism transcriptional regulator PhnF [Sphingomonas sp. 3P27F8]